MESPLRILCFHGFTDSPRKMKYGFRRLVNLSEESGRGSNKLEYIFAKGTIHLPRDVAQEFYEHIKLRYTDDDLDDSYAWWRASNDGKIYNGWEETEAYLRKLDNDYGPFHAIIGFSQGAVLANILCALQQRTSDPPIRFSRAVMFAPFPSQAERFQELFNEEQDPISLPTLHVVGKKDPATKFLPLVLAHYVSPVEIVFEGGHHPPRQEDVNQTVLDFICKPNSHL